MQLGSIRVGDVVRVDRKGRRFMALVTDKQDRELTVMPCDSRISYRSATSREVIGHWRASKVTAARGALAEVQR